MNVVVTEMSSDMAALVSALMFLILSLYLLRISSFAASCFLLFLATIHQMNAARAKAYII